MVPTKKSLRIIVFALDLAFRIIGAFVIAVFLGDFIDGIFDSGHIALLILLVLACINILYTLLTISKKYGK